MSREHRSWLRYLLAGLVENIDLFVERKQSERQTQRWNELGGFELEKTTSYSSIFVDRDDDSSRRKSEGWLTNGTWNFADSQKRKIAWWICLSSDRPTIVIKILSTFSGSIPTSTNQFRAARRTYVMALSECLLEIWSLIQKWNKRRIKHRAHKRWNKRRAQLRDKTEGEYRRRSSSWSTLDTKICNRFDRIPKSC